MSDWKIVLLLTLCAFSCLVESSKYIQKCIDDIVNWCDKQNYISEGSRWGITETVSGKVVHRECETYNYGITCPQINKTNNPEWFKCSLDHNATYKGTVLQKNSLNGADVEICYASSRIFRIINAPVKASGLTTDEKKKCIDNFKEWCNKQDYTNVKSTSWQYTGLFVGKLVHMICNTHQNGTQCSLITPSVELDIFTCFPNHTAIFKRGTELQYAENAENDELCFAEPYITCYGKPLPLVETTEDRQECVNEIVKWCENQDYTDAVTSEARTTFTKKGKTETTYCITANSGKNCTKNDLPWYSCTKDHTAYFKNIELRKDSLYGSDDQICGTSKKITYS